MTKNTQAPEKEAQTLKERIDNLPHARRQAVIDGIAEACDVSLSTVYRWLNDETQIGKLQREKIEELIEL